MNDFVKRLQEIAPAGRILLNEPMKNHTTFRIGGPADALFFPSSEEELIAARKAAREAGVPCTIIGNGSNLLVRDGGIRGLTITLGEEFGAITAEENILTAQAGAMLSRLSREAQVRGLSGLAFAAGIPGSVGGGVAMNAGAYGGEIKDTLLCARVLGAEDEPVWLDADDLELGYRSSRVLREGLTVLQARFRLTPGNPDDILAEMNEYNRRRREKQPLSLPSAGSAFKRPEGHFAGALIQEAGLKGLSVGGAQVSALHAGFIVNTGGAACRDVLDLIALVQRRVMEQSGVLLEPEVRVIGSDV